ncbi:MAG: preprotein translocase subunit SecY [Minisyncoccales bacterium]
MNLQGIFSFIPEVEKPVEKKVSFNTKLKWTIIVLAGFFILSNIPLFGLSEVALERLTYLSTVLAADFGTYTTLGIGPIVMASIILQLLAGSGIVNIDTSTPEGRRFFQGLQKLLIFGFILFEALVYVLMGGISSEPAMGVGGEWLLIFQLILGGLAIYYMNEVSEKWGFISGVSLFIAAGVSRSLFTGAFQFINAQGRNCLLDFNNVACSGKILVIIQSIINQYPIELFSALAALMATIIIFLLVVWAQALKVEIPLSFGRIRGYGMKWPLSFFYASVIPVILTAALIANIQIFGGIIEGSASGCFDGNTIDRSLDTCTGGGKIASYFTFLGRFSDGQAVSGLAFWMGSTNLLELAIRGGLMPKFIFQGLTHILVFTIFSTMFSIFWVKTSGMDSKAQAKKIANSGLQVAGFRQDIRILESILDRYIMPLTVMGGIAIGLLASLTDLLGALASGTAILLVIMIMYQLYQNIAQQHSVDMNPAMRKFIGG